MLAVCAKPAFSSLKINQIICVAGVCQALQLVFPCSNVTGEAEQKPA
jgi:hypothetical protein